MSLQNRIKALAKVGSILTSIANKEAWKGFETGITQEEYDSFADWIYKVKIYNGWFEPSEVTRAFESWGIALTRENLENWLSLYPITENERPKNIAIIMAGNIPLVGLHDLICVYLTGNNALVKMSSDDDKLLPVLLKIWACFDDEITTSVKFVQGKMLGFDAVIATGSNNSARYFEQYFGTYPNIIRKNRTSVALLTGKESIEEMKLLADDIFAYYGLGCRNVTKLFVPKGYDLDLVFGGIFHYKEIVNNKKYGNNYDYHQAVFLLEGYDIIENGFILFKEDEQLKSPIGTLFYEYYEDEKEVVNRLQAAEQEIQCIVSSNHVPFGSAQCPTLADYSDGVDTVAFLLGL